MSTNELREQLTAKGIPWCSLHESSKCRETGWEYNHREFYYYEDLTNGYTKLKVWSTSSQNVSPEYALAVTELDIL